MDKHCNTSGSIIDIVKYCQLFANQNHIYIISPNQSELGLHIPLTAATNIPFQGVQACLVVVTEQKALYEVSGCKRSLTNPKITSKYIWMAIKAQCSLYFYTWYNKSIVNVCKLFTFIGNFKIMLNL